MIPIFIMLVVASTSARAFELLSQNETVEPGDVFDFTLQIRNGDISDSMLKRILDNKVVPEIFFVEINNREIIG